MINGLSIDLEDWYHPELVRERIQGMPASQAMESTRPILDLLDRYRIKASFFILGEVAERNPDLIRSIFRSGHEIGCHGYSHKPLWKLSESLFREELERFHSLMKEILGKVEIKGFRAPTFSLDHRTRWALQVLRDFGYQYDASIFPLKITSLYGVQGAPTHPYRISFEEVGKEDPQSPLMEAPICPLRIGGMKLPISGGFYLRALPIPFLRWGLRRINRSQPFIIYFHPWEGYPETPRMKLPLYNRTISYYGISSAIKKFEYLLKHFRFSRIDRLLGLGEKA